MRALLLGICVMALGCADARTRVPPSRPASGAVATASRVTPYCAVELRAPEQWQVSLDADDVPGVDCIPPAGGELFSFGFAHAGWWLQLDLARRSVTVGQPHAFDGQAALLALDCWDWDGSVTVDADDDDDWALRLDARCRDDAGKAIAGSFRGRKM